MNVRDDATSGWPEVITRANAQDRGGFSSYRKVAATRISDFVVEPGVIYETPEGLHAEDEATRVAFDVQGGVYPIRESVFRASYEPVAEPDEGADGSDAAAIARAYEEDAG